MDCDKHWNGRISHEKLVEILEYNPKTGEFIWKSVPKRRDLVGAVAGGRRTIHGYCCIKIDGKLYAAHHLAWFYFYKKWPNLVLDHINGDGADNRISNLREATRAQNGWNQKIRSTNTSGYKGVSFEKETGRWTASILGRRIGRFNSPETAYAAYVKRARELFGEFARVA